MINKSNVLRLAVDKSKIDLLHENKKNKAGAPISDVLDEPTAEALYPNQYVVVSDDKYSVVCRVSGDCEKLVVVDRNISVGDIRPRKGNEEQLIALDALLDPSIPVVVLTGRAGTGKTLLTLAAALAQHKASVYGSIVLTKPMVQVGAQEFGILPGEINEKYMPYLGNYIGNLEEILGNVPPDLTKIGLETVPLQFIRGVSWNHRFVIADEIQTLTRDEILTLGTRVGQGTKLVLMGDLRQRDIDIAIKDTGLWGLLNSGYFNGSNLTAAIELKKVERSPVTELFATIFEER